MKVLSILGAVLLWLEVGYCEPTFIVNEPRTTPIQGSTIGKVGAAAVDRYGNLFVNNSSTGTVTTATWASASYAFGSITNAFTTALSNSASFRFCKLQNTTDKDLIYAFDGATGIYITSGGLDYYDFATDGRAVVSNVSVKYAVGSPTLGAFQVACYS